MTGRDDSRQRNRAMNKTPKKPEERKQITPLELARMGGGEVAYIRPMRVEEAVRILGAPIDAPPGTKLYGVFHADGQPILIADSKAGALANLIEQELEPASVH